MSLQVFAHAAAMCGSRGDDQLIGRADIDVLERATSQPRVVVTHDVAFGRSPIRTGAPFVRIIYLLPAL